MNELEKYYNSILQEVNAMVESEEDGASPENKFTEFMVESLIEAGETENVFICTDIKENDKGKRQHKINGYALSETYETIDLFISIFQTTENYSSVGKDDVTTHSNLAKRFFHDAIKGKIKDMEESAPVYDFVRTLLRFREDIVRVNIFIITNGKTLGDPPKDTEIVIVVDQEDRSIFIKYHLWDLERFYQLYTSKNKREPIQIDFNNNFGGAVPCLSMVSENEDYESYLAIIAGNTLSDIYREFGSRLLEQNVRSFLQFTGKINKGIRDTIKKEPHMFLAFNNGIAATAEEVEIINLENGGKGIAKVKDFQIVNGGQTTASIFHSQKQDKSDLTHIFVQVKLTIVKKKDEFASIVSRIAEYANSQNKVSVADLSSNHPFHIELEKLSRLTWAPNPTNRNQQTRWFYERARGQYKNELNKEGTTPAKRKAFEIKTPKNQLFQKELLAKFYNAWNLFPYFVARGSQKNYIEFLKNYIDVLRNNKKQLPNSIFFEDAIAMGILFKTSEKEYGVGGKAIGDLRFLVVPYTLSYLNEITNKKIDLLKIWKNQAVSNELRKIIQKLLENIHHFLKKYDGLVSEWGKKEDCWKELKTKRFNDIDLEFIKNDFIDEKNQKRYLIEDSTIQEWEKQNQLNKIKNTPISLWKKIWEWGKTTKELTLHKLNIIEEIISKIKQNLSFRETHITNGLEILDITFEKNPDLFLDNQENDF